MVRASTTSCAEDARIGIVPSGGRVSCELVDTRPVMVDPHEPECAAFDVPELHDGRSVDRAHRS